MVEVVAHSIGTWLGRLESFDYDLVVAMCCSGYSTGSCSRRTPQAVRPPDDWGCIRQASYSGDSDHSNSLPWCDTTVFH